MIPIIRSLSELMAMTHSRDRFQKLPKKCQIDALEDNIDKEKRDIRSRNKEKVNLPDLHKSKRLRWIHKKKYISKLIDKLDYNNQIQSSYDLTLQEIQNKKNHKEVA